ncbi:MAG: hypothetical protein JRI72_11880 [Deltaproteobacteria bacterium]|nr:hypothetical protein [Deltaproteobacteria bacterium]
MSGKDIILVVFLAGFILMWEYSSVVLAGTLTIETKTTVKTEGDRLKGSIKVCNKGNVAAHNVQANISVLGEQIKTRTKKLLTIDEFYTFQFEKTIPGIKKGRYPLTVIVDFHDVNQYPFSAISCTTFFFQEDANPDLLCLIDGLTMDKKGELHIDIKNVGLGLRNIRATLILPREFSSPDPQIDFDIESRSQKTVEFAIENFYALSGASYPVFCVFEYDLRDTHYTAFSSAVVKIAKRENWFWRTRWFWVAIAVILGAAFFWYQLKKKFNYSATKTQRPEDLPD